MVSVRGQPATATWPAKPSAPSWPLAIPVAAAAEQQLDVLRAAQVHVLPQERLEERAGVDVVVEDL
jgi:hypothetical protein